MQDINTIPITLTITRNGILDYIKPKYQEMIITYANVRHWYICVMEIAL